MRKSDATERIGFDTAFVMITDGVVFFLMSVSFNVVLTDGKRVIKLSIEVAVFAWPIGLYSIRRVPSLACRSNIFCPLTLMQFVSMSQIASSSCFNCEAEISVPFA